MSQWAWVTFAYTVTLTSMGAYAVWSHLRLRSLRRRLEEWR